MPGRDISTLLTDLGLDANAAEMSAVVAVLVLACAVIQKIFRRELERDQYYYLRDICVLASWAICGIWTKSAPMKLMITAGVIAGLIGFCQKVVKGWDLRFCYLAVGFGVALLGPRISFIGSPDGEFLYLPSITTIMVLITLWISLFPILLQEIDEVPGMGGCFLLASWLMMVTVTFLSSKSFSDALMMSICGIALIIVFWSRHINVYRRLGTPLSAMWGALLAGTSMLGASKGVAFATVMFLPLGLFAIPIIETLISVSTAVLSPKPVGSMMLYRAIVSTGIEHPTAVFFVTAASAVMGGSIASLMMGIVDVFSLILTLVLLGAGCFVACAHSREENTGLSERPSLWGVSVDNFSVDYALGRVAGWITADTTPQMIVTPDALAALRSRRDKRYAKIISDAGLVLPDGTGLVWALRFLGSPLRERIPGVEFADHLCRIAAAHGWPVFFFGGKPGIADRAAQKMQSKYSALKVAGTRSGYFKAEQSDEIAQEISASGARIVFVALGVPKQEYWIADHMQTMKGTVAIGVGGTLDVMSGALKRAPLSWRRLRLEWLYRVIQEPSRWRRVIKLPVFVMLVLMKKLHIDL